MNFGYSDFRLRTCELKAPQCFLIEKLILYSAGFLAGHIGHFHSIFTASYVIINQSAFRIFLHHPIRCGHAVAVNQSDVALFIFTFGREALAGIHQKVRHISKHLLAYAHKCFPTCKSATGQPAGVESKVSPFCKIINQGDKPHESMTK